MFKVIFYVYGQLHRYGHEMNVTKAKLTEYDMMEILNGQRVDNIWRRTLISDYVT